KKSEATPSKSLIKTGKPCDNYINFDDYMKQNITKETEVTLHVEISKDISIWLHLLLNKEKKSDHLYKIGRTKNVDRRLEQWENHCNYKVKLIQALPEGKKCKYTHSTERLIHLELEEYRVDLLCDMFNSGEMGEFRREGLRI
ncbi:24219_t:CDS:2, partial [Cetraspora pellucida]